MYKYSWQLWKIDRTALSLPLKWAERQRELGICLKNDTVGLSLDEEKEWLDCVGENFTAGSMSRPLTFRYGALKSAPHLDHLGYFK